MTSLLSLRTASVAAAVALLCCAASVRAEETADAAALVEKLRAEDFDERQTATEKLAALGEAARPALEKALSSQDPEIKEAVRKLLAKLERATVQVLCFDRNGKPAAEAQADVNVYRYSEGNRQDSHSTTVGADGNATLPALQPGAAQLHFNWKKWFATADAPSNFALNLRTGNNPVLMLLTKGGTLCGTLTDPDGKPLKDGQLALYPNSRFDPDILDVQVQCADQWRQERQSGTCDAEGKVRVEGVPDGVYQCVASCAGYFSALAPPVRVRENDQIELAPMSLRPRPKAKFQFVLQNTEGAPLKKAKLSASLEPILEGPNAAENQRKLRYLKQQIEARGGGMGGGTQLETDDDGKVTMEDVDVGKSRLVVRVENEAQQTFDDVTIAAKPGEPPVFKLLPTGGLSGRVLSAKGEGVRYANITVTLQDEIDEQNMTPYYHHRSANRVSTQQNGTYEYKKLAPGTYAVCIWASNQLVWIFGVQVVAGKTVNAPDATVPEARGGGQDYATVKGTVLLADGNPAAAAQLQMIGAAGVYQQSQCDEKGNFQIQRMKEGASQLIARAAGHKPCAVDLADKKLDLNAVAVRLEKQSHGTLRVKVVDEKDQPLSGVAVMPVAGSAQNRHQYYGAPAMYRGGKTNENGMVRLTGLAAGERKLRAQKEGYFLPEDVKVTVSADAEQEALVKMRLGFLVTGAIQLPPGLPPENVLVGLDTLQRFVRLGPNGAFGIDGVAPGKYKVLVRAPTALLPEEQPLEITQAPPPALKLKLVRRGGLALKLDTSLDGWSAALTLKAACRIDAPEEALATRAHTVVDSSGRAEFWGVAPGSYCVLLTPPSDPYRIQQYPRQGGRQTQASQLVGPLEVKPVQTLAEVAALPGQELPCKLGKGSVTARLTIDSVAPRNFSGGANLQVRVLSTAATGTTNFNYPYEFQQNAGSTNAPIVIGTPPAGIKPAATGGFTFTALPPGDYKLFALMTQYPRYDGRSAPVTPKPVVTELAAFTLKADEQLDLGAIKYNPQPSGASGTPNTLEGLLEPDDLVPMFQP